MPTRRQPRGTSPWLLAALVGLLGLLGLTHPSAALASPTGSPGAAPAGSDGPPPPTVFFGVQGLTWDDIDPDHTPRLWELASAGGIANLSVRTVTSHTCPVDAWLTVSAGQRATDKPHAGSGCAAPPAPVSDDDGAVVPNYADLVAANAGSSYAAHLGLLGDEVTRDGTTLAVGAGGALALADQRGTVDRYRAGVEDLRESDWQGPAPLVAAVDLGDLGADLEQSRLESQERTDGQTGRQNARDTVREPNPDQTAPGQSEPPRPEPPRSETEFEGPYEDDPAEDAPAEDRAERLREADDRVRDVLRGAPDDVRVVVSGLSSPPGPPSLTAAIYHDGESDAPSFLASSSTRREGLVTLADITATLVPANESTTHRVVGGPFEAVARSGSTADDVQQLRDSNTAAQVVQDLMFGFFSSLVAAQLLIYAAAAYVVRRYAGRPRHWILSATRVVALAGASFPVASYLANLLPWWHSSVPHIALLGTMALAVSGVVAVAMGGPWRRTILGPATVVASVTALVLLVDTVTGARLQLNALTGYTAIVAGRFFGVGNIALATFTTGTLMAVAGLAHVLDRAGRHRLAVALSAVIGLTVIGVIGLPGLGTSFGGMIAAVPGVAVTVAMIAGLRVGVVRVLVVSGVGVVLVGVVAFLDYLRPPGQRTHFGAFFEQLVGGDAGVIVLRKLEAMVGTLGNWQLTLLAGVALLFLFLVLNNPTDWRAGTLQRAYEYAPTLRAGLTGTLVTGLVGFAANDSGVAIPAIALTVAVPLTLSACLWVLIQEDSDTPPNSDTSNGVVSSEGRP
ncbi:hypothetical protein J4H86_12585 [Spiractinospora alimapuensis]|uniref:hypothetical protein n=1 Tax=Spiractinospora alimapuensis TaxID=2820884 RepID=UPI001F22E5DC|nr:hypothetical protein [Spiractinospora alimapuensis]QVQ54427.1 hypothetical protein J4H86_12585 [Spiractinospora alimapuensis]